jgi:predicted glycosyltransferase involved in capsule biosynthesis
MVKLINRDLNDFTFLILVRIDSIERIENLIAVTTFIQQHFDTNIYVLECASYYNGLLKRLLNKKIYYSFQENFDPILHRTQYLNQMIETVTTPFLAVWDADVLVPVSQLYTCIELLRSNNMDFVYPYERYFLEVANSIRTIYLKSKQINILVKNTAKMEELYAPNPLGGGFLCNTKAYIDAGGENEKYYGWGIEDAERFQRFIQSGYRVKRLTGVMYHLCHPRGLNSKLHHSDQEIIKNRLLHASVFNSQKVKHNNNDK